MAFRSTASDPVAYTPDGAASVPTTAYAGLSEDEAARRLAEGLGNKIGGSRTRSVLQIFRDNIFTFFNLINVLLGAVVLIAVLRDFRFAKNLLFLMVVVLNTGIGIVQEWRAKRTVDKLSILTESKANVSRDGRVREIPCTDILLDDLLILESGRQILVDGEVLHADAFEVDESLISGESEAVLKKAGDCVFSGSFVVAGSAAVRVTKVSHETLAARISSDAKQENRKTSQLFVSLNRLLKVISLFIFPLGLVISLKQGLLHAAFPSPEESVRLVSLLLSMIPDGLVLLTSIAFAVSVAELAKRRCLVQTMPAIESLARVDTLCLDKTGTITSGRMQLEKLLILDDKFRITGEENLSESFMFMTSCQHDVKVNTASFSPSGDPETLHKIHRALHGLALAFPKGNATQTAINERFLSPGNRDGSLGAPPDVRQVFPFSSARKWSGAHFGGDMQATWILAAAEILPALRNEPALMERLHREAEAAYRVLLLAEVPGSGEGATTGRADATELTQVAENARPRAVLLIRDEIRPDAPQTFRYFREQGIQIKLISGDQTRTVQAIARSAGIEGLERAIDLSEIPEDADLDEIARNHELFGRVSPFQKRALLRAMRGDGHTIAMTGDGVNDVLALKDADCGIAMASGSDAARGVADIVLLDNQMSALSDAFKEGRRVVNNIQRVSSLFLIKTIYASFFAFLMLLLPIAYPVYPIQMTLVSSSTIGIPAFFLALQPKRERISGNFFANVLPVSIAPGLTALLILLGLQLIGNLAGFDAAWTGSASLLLLLLVGFRSVYEISKPFNLFRCAVLCGCILIASLGLLLFPKIFEFQRVWQGRALLWLLPAAVLALLLTQALYWLLRRPAVRRCLRRRLGPSKEDLENADKKKAARHA